MSPLQGLERDGGLQIPGEQPGSCLVVGSREPRGLTSDSETGRARGYREEVDPPGEVGDESH